ncbi:MAG TPA: hypothetical protein VKT18_03800, partial [Acidimicrobiales bacterium]|nr:hypothetical protein [Acidimicrobiales bacterium]
MHPPRRQRTAATGCRWLVATLRRHASTLDTWVRGRALATLARTDVLRTTHVAVRTLHRADRASSYRVRALTGVHLAAIAQLSEHGALSDAVDAAESIDADLVALGRSRSFEALRARAERAKCLARLDRGDEAVESLVDVLRDAAAADGVDARWRLTCRLALAVMRRDLGDLEQSTDELRALVADVREEFGEDSGWAVATITELATNVALGGDAATALEMAASLLPRATTTLGPLSIDALTLRSRISRWSLDEDAERAERLAASAVVDFTRAGLSTCAEALELRYVLADAHFGRGDVDYAIAQLASLRDDLEESSWATSPFADVVRAELAEWRDAQQGRS